MKGIYKVHNVDAREIDSVLKEPVVDVTITSPPYFNLKDYGSDNQIGFGQDYEEYLDDLKLVFEKVYHVTKNTGTLWVIIDAFRKDGEVVPLPFDFSNKISQVGWKLQEIIIWGKDRTVPWAHKGQMRNLFEYVLMFSKSNDYKFNVDRVRDVESLKKWWVKYPERYNPKGKTPDVIWNFEIPTQGSWGSGYIRHFCPLPEEMIAQMLKITTDEDDVVLDCFSGSGAVLSKADNMKRKFVGFEINSEYISMFDNYLSKTGSKKRREYELEEKASMKQDKFEKVIIDLRSLKYSRILLKKLRDQDIDDVLKIYVEKTKKKPVKKNGLIVVNYHLLIKSNKNVNKIEKAIEGVISRAPLSKFGVEPIIKLEEDQSSFSGLFKGKNYNYTIKSTHKFKKVFESKDLNPSDKSNVIFSKIKVDLDEKDYE